MRNPSLCPEHNLRRAAEERQKAAACLDAVSRRGRIELAEIFERRAVEALHPAEIH